MDKKITKEEQILDEILKNTYTVESLKKRAQALRLKLSGKIYKSHDDSPVAEKKISSEEEWLSKFDEKLLEGITSSEFSSLSEYIDKFIGSINSLTIYFVFLPEEKQIEEVGTWLRTSLNNPKLVFTAKTDPALIGGCAVVYKGVYKDYSLRAKISANQDKLIEEFRQYFKQ